MQYQICDRSEPFTWNQPPGDTAPHQAQLYGSRRRRRLTRVDGIRGGQVARRQWSALNSVGERFSAKARPAPSVRATAPRKIGVVLGCARAVQNLADLDVQRLRRERLLHKGHLGREHTVAHNRTIGIP